MHRLVLSVAVVAFCVLGFTGTALAGPADSATALALPRTTPPPITFGY